MYFRLRSSAATAAPGDAMEVILARASWERLLDLARAEGWRPVGTQSPRPLRPGQSWSGSYTDGVGELVVSADAARLAQAVTDALPELDSPPFDLGMAADPEAAHVNTTPLGTPLDAGEWFRRDGRAVAMAFLDLARQGAFHIESA